MLKSRNETYEKDLQSAAVIGKVLGKNTKMQQILGATPVSGCNSLPANGPPKKAEGGVWHLELTTVQLT